MIVIISIIIIIIIIISSSSSSEDRIKDACIRYAKMETMLGEVAADGAGAPDPAAPDVW